MNDVESVNLWAVSLLEFETTLSNENVHFQLLLNELSTLVDVSNKIINNFYFNIISSSLYPTYYCSLYFIMHYCLDGHYFLSLSLF